MEDTNLRKKITRSTLEEYINIGELEKKRRRLVAIETLCTLK